MLYNYYSWFLFGAFLKFGLLFHKAADFFRPIFLVYIKLTKINILCLHIKISLNIEFQNIEYLVL